LNVKLIKSHRIEENKSLRTKRKTFEERRKKWILIIFRYIGNIYYCRKIGKRKTVNGSHMKKIILVKDLI